MRSLAKRLGVLFVLLLFPLFVQSMAEAYTYVYDDFNTTPDSKWTSQGATGLFTFGGGTLNFSASASTNEQFLYASYLGNPVQFRNITGASIQFSNYSSTNTYAAGHGASSYVGFEVSENVQNFIYIIRGHNGGTGGGGSADLFEVYYMKNNVFSSGSYVYVSPDPVSGMLGFVVSSSGIQAEYNLGTDPSTGWQNLGAPLQLASYQWLGIDIRGNAGLSGSTSFSLDNAAVTFTQTPIPSAFLLLGPGLAGLAAIRRKLKN